MRGKGKRGLRSIDEWQTVVPPTAHQRKMKDVRIQELDQAEADRLRGSLSGECLRLVQFGFKPEEDRLRGGGGWSHPRDCRVYYLVLLDGTPYLLVGINLSPPHAINISSIARVVIGPPGYALLYLRRLIEETCVPMCHDLKKQFILARAATRDGARLLRWLTAKGLRGVESITFERSFWKAVVAPHSSRLARIVSSIGCGVGAPPVGERLARSVSG